MEPILSVIVPVYNSEKYLERCVESVMASSLKNLEIILVNDGSSDCSDKLCDRLAQRDKRIVVIHQQNAGVSAARNRGLEKAEGKYFAFVDSDDYIEPYMYEKMIASMEKNDADLVCCGFCREYEGETRRTKENSCESIERIVDRDQAMELLIGVQNGISTMVANKIGKRSIQIENNICFDENLYECEDGAFWCDYIASIGKAVWRNDIFYHYVIHDKNISRNWRIGRSKRSNFLAWNHIIRKCGLISEDLVSLAELRYQIYLRKMLFEAYCSFGYRAEIDNLIPKLKYYRKQLYLSKNLTLKRKIYYFGCGVIVKYDLGHGTAVLWKRIRETCRK